MGKNINKLKTMYFESEIKISVYFSFNLLEYFFNKEFLGSKPIKISTMKYRLENESDN